MTFDDFNPDCMVLDDVTAWRDYLETTPELFPGQARGEETVRELALYCARKVEAMKSRVAGDIQVALLCERECDYIYRRLPSFAKW